MGKQHTFESEVPDWYPVLVTAAQIRTVDPALRAARPGHGSFDSARAFAFRPEGSSCPG